jgi:hypothetical protein
VPEQGPRPYRMQLGQILAKVWADPAFKQRLLADPKSALREEGVQVPEGLDVRVHENTDRVLHIVLPQEPEAVELSDEDLEDISGGTGATAGVRG